MRYLAHLFILFSALFSSAQSSMDFHVSSISGKYFYKDYESFINSYNAFYGDDPDLISPMNAKTLATGFQIGSTFNLEEWFNGSIDISSVKTGVSKAVWEAGYERGLQLKSFLFDMDFGFYVLPEESPIRISVGLGFSLQSTQIHSFMDFGKDRSYGSETRLNGVYSSWKGAIPFVLKVSYLTPDEHWKFFINTKFPITSKKPSSIGYQRSASFTTSGDVFPLDVFGNWDYENRMREDFRFVNISVGVAYHFFFY